MKGYGAITEKLFSGKFFQDIEAIDQLYSIYKKTGEDNDKIKLTRNILKFYADSPYTELYDTIGLALSNKSTYTCFNPEKAESFIHYFHFVVLDSYITRNEISKENKNLITTKNTADEKMVVKASTIAKKLGYFEKLYELPDDVLEIILTELKKYKSFQKKSLTVEKIKLKAYEYEMKNKPTSLDSPIGNDDDDDITMIDVVPSKEKSPEEIAEITDRIRNVLNNIKKLEEKEKYAILYRTIKTYVQDDQDFICYEQLIQKLCDESNCPVIYNYLKKFIKKHKTFPSEKDFAKTLKMSPSFSQLIYKIRKKIAV